MTRDVVACNCHKHWTSRVLIVMLPAGGGMFFDHPHLFKKSRSHGLNHGFQLESGMRVTVATVRPLAHVFQCQISDRAYDRKDKQNIPLAIAFLQLFKSIGDAACSLGGRDLTPTLRAAIPDVRLTGQLFDLLLSGYLTPKLSLYCAMEDLSTGHQLMLCAFNKYQKDFIPTSLYLRWQVTFQTLFITLKVMQVRDPTVSLYICRGGEKLRSAIFRNFPQFRNFSQFSEIFRNFPQFSAIFPQFFTLPDFLTASPRWCRTMKKFFFYYSIHSQMLQSHQNLV